MIYFDATLTSPSDQPSILEGRAIISPEKKKYKKHFKEFTYCVEEELGDKDFPGDPTGYLTLM